MSYTEAHFSMSDSDRIKRLEAVVAKQADQIADLFLALKYTADVLSDLQIVKNGDGSLTVDCDPMPIYEVLGNGENPQAAI